MIAALRTLALTLLALALLAAALIGWFVVTPKPEPPALAGAITRGEIVVGGRTRTYLVYAPPNLPAGAPLVLVLHGSGGGGARMRADTGYGFDRLADAHGFVVAYPTGFEGYWNACNTVGDFAANTLNIDDVGFLVALADKLGAERGVDPARTFAAGLSRGGAMAYRLALEAPQRFRAVAAVAASVPAPDNSKCAPAGEGATSVMILNGTKDPLNPFAGGEVSLYGVMTNRGVVLSSQDSAASFAARYALGAPQAPEETALADGFRIVRTRWRNGSPIEVDHVAIVGAGHVWPNPWKRAPRVLGATPRLDAATEIWTFFAAQRPR